MTIEFMPILLWKKKRQEKGSHKLGVELDTKFSSIDTSSKVQMCFNQVPAIWPLNVLQIQAFHFWQNTGALLFKLLASDGSSDVPYMEVVTSVTSSAGLANTLEDLLCKCLVEGVQCSKLFQDFTRGICYIRPWMERRGVPWCQVRCARVSTGLIDVKGWNIWHKTGREFGGKNPLHTTCWHYF